MITLFGQHKVKDFDAFMRAAADGMAENNQRSIDMGIQQTSVYRLANGDGVLVTHEFDDLEAAQNYERLTKSAEFVAMVEGMGGILPGNFWIGEQLEM
jgi:hypothetical protein